MGNSHSAAIPKDVVSRLQMKGFIADENWVSNPITGGGFSQLYRGITKDGKEFALKLSHADYIKKIAMETSSTDYQKVKRLLDQLVDEGRKLTNLHHPFVVHFEDFFQLETGEDWKVACVIMPFYEGGTLQDKIDRAATGKNESQISVTQIQKWFLQIGLALEYVHDRKLVHLDVRPANIFISGSNEAILGDFGASIAFEDCHLLANSSSYLLLTLVGQPCYFSPERSSEQWEPSPADDVWAFGVTLYAATGRSLSFEKHGKNLSALARAISEKNHPQVEGADDLLLDLISGLLTNSVDDRPTMRRVVRHDFFQPNPQLNDESLTATCMICTENLYLHMKNKLHTNSPINRTPLDAALAIWLDELDKATEEAETNYGAWNDQVVQQLVPIYEAASKAMREHTKNAKIATIAGGAAGLVGASLGATGLLLTLTGFLAPLGGPLIVGGAGVGVAGAVNGAGAAVVRVVLEKIHKDDVEKCQSVCRKCDDDFCVKLRGLIDLLPEDRLEEAVGVNLDLNAGLTESLAVVSKALGAAESVAEGAQPLTRVSGLRVASLVLLPVGAAFDVFAAGAKLKGCSLADYLDALCRLLRGKDQSVSPTIEFARNILEESKGLALGESPTVAIRADGY